ncbi:MAG: NAD(P)-binding oxidoreductase [Bifidobacterium sp.]|nr:NAD(P)-binding oxidoreductase [Bifidobacterium sp.]
MKVFVAGASGRVGQDLVKDLVAAGHEVMAGSRHPVEPSPEGVTPVELDLHASDADLADAVEGADAVYFVAGSRGKDLLQTDLFGAVKLMNAAQIDGIRRFVLLSSMFADEPQRWDDPALKDITDYNIAKFFADQWLMDNTDLDWTIVQPGNLVEGAEGSGKVDLDPLHSTPNSIPNVAAVLAGVLDRPNTYGHIIMMPDGDTPIADALDAVGHVQI